MSLIFEEKLIFLDNLNSLEDTSFVESEFFFNSFILTLLISKPIVLYFLPNSIAKGKPT